MLSNYLLKEKKKKIYDAKPHQGWALWTHPWGLNHGYMTPLARTVSGNPDKLLVGFKPRMFETLVHPMSATTRLHHDGLTKTTLFNSFCKELNCNFKNCFSKKCTL